MKAARGFFALHVLCHNVSISDEAFSVWHDAGDLIVGLRQADPITPETWIEHRESLIEQIASWREKMRKIAIMAGNNDPVRQRDWGFPDGVNDACFTDPHDWPERHK